MQEKINKRDWAVNQGMETININGRLGEAQRMDGDEWRRLERRRGDNGRGGSS